MNVRIEPASKRLAADIERSGILAHDIPTRETVGSPPLKIVALSGNTHRPSKSRALAAHLAHLVGERTGAIVEQVDLVDAGRGLGSAWARSELTPQALAVVSAVETADALIVVTPVYKGSYAGLLKHLFDLVEPFSLVDRPVLIGATGGGHRHALIVEHQLRPLFGFFSALTAPSAVYASDSEFRDGEPAEALLLARAEQAADQFAALLSARRLAAQVYPISQAAE